MDPTVYGDNKAAITLVSLISRHPSSKKISRKVGRLFEHTFSMFNELATIPHPGTVRRMIHLLHDDIVANHLLFLNELDPLEKDIKTYTQNALAAKVKKMLY